MFGFDKEDAYEEEQAFGDLVLMEEVAGLPDCIQRKQDLVGFM
jgi:hypothetical protein